MRHMRRYIARTVLVTSSAAVFKGTLLTADRDGLTLDRPERLDGPTAGPHDGQVFIPTAAVAWAQVV